MEARKEKKGQKIIGKIDSGKMSVKKGNKKLDKLQKRTAKKSARKDRKITRLRKGHEWTPNYYLNTRGDTPLATTPKAKQEKRR
jgi:hypothetical protein